MPIKGEVTRVYFGTPDGNVLGELDTVTSVELSAEAKNYVSDVSTFFSREQSFSGSFKLETNNERKMNGKPLWRRRVRIQRLFDQRPPKRRDKRVKE